MTVFVLPTRGSTPYRGKYPHRARYISGYVRGSTGRHVELNDGTRLWSAESRIPAFAMGELKTDYAGIVDAAIPMTDSQYETLKEAAELLRERTGLAGRNKRAALEARVRAKVESIQASGGQYAKRNAENARRHAVSGNPRAAFNPAKPFRAYAVTPVSSFNFDFETLQQAREYLLDQIGRAEFIRSGAAPAGPRCFDPLGSFIIWAEGVETLADAPWNYDCDAPGGDWTRKPSVVKASDPREGEGPKRYYGELTEAEKAEVTARGFPRGGDIRYFLKRPYPEGDAFKLSRWTRLPSPGRPRTADDDKAEALLSAEMQTQADSIGALAILEYDCGAVYFPDDAHALRSWIDASDCAANPIFWTRPATDIPFVASALPPSKEEAEIFAAPRFAFLIYQCSDGRKLLCEGGVYTDDRALRESDPEGNYRDQTIAKAHEDAAGHNGASFDCSAYKVVTDPRGIIVEDMEVLSSLTDWQRAILESPMTGDVRVVGAIDLTPTWSAILPILVAALENGTETGRKLAREELARMASLADQRNDFATRLDAIREAADACKTDLDVLARTAGIASHKSINRQRDFRAQIDELIKESK